MIQHKCNLHYNIYGDGVPVVLVHGFGEDGSIWDNQVNFLKDHCKVIVPDLQGTRSSPLIEDKSALTIDHMANDIKDLLDQENISQCILLGHSMGGYITLAFVEKYPNYLKGFGLIHSSAYADNEAKKTNRARGIEIIAEYGGYSFLKNTIPNLFGEVFKEAFSDAVDELIEKSKLFSNTSLQAYYHAMMVRPDRAIILKETVLPILMIAGTEDIAAPINDVLEQSKLPTLKYLHVLEGVGHMGMWEATKQVNEFMLNFIENIR